MASIRSSLLIALGPLHHIFCTPKLHGLIVDLLLQPKGGGIWHPDAAPLAALRQSIDRNSRDLKDILLNDNLRKEFLDGAPRNDVKVVKAFVASNAENALKTKPKGFDADHADIDLLRLRNYTIGRKLPQDQLTGEGGLDRVARLFTCLQPFITYLNSVVMPDESPSEEEDGPAGTDEDEEEEEES